MPQLSKNHAQRGVEKIRFEAGHTYKQMAAEVGYSEQMMAKVCRGERTLSEERVQLITKRYSELLGRHVTTNEVLGKSETMLMSLETMHERIPTQQGDMPLFDSDHTTQYELTDMERYIPAGSYITVTDDATLADKNIYLVRHEGRNVARIYKTDAGQPRFESAPLTGDTEQLFLTSASVQVLTRITSATKIL